MFSLETDLLVEIARLLTKGATPSADWKIKKLAALGVLNRKTIAIIRRYQKEILTATQAEIVATANRALREMQAMGLAVEMTPRLSQTLAVWISGAQKDLNLAMATMAQAAGAKYVAAVEKASAHILAGDEAFAAALKRAMIEAGGNMTVYADKAGRQWGPEGYTSMVMRSNQRRVATDVSFSAADQVGTDLIEVSSHIGARPGCAPYQGRVFSLYGRTPGYPRLQETSYGEIDGLGGANCGHSFYPFIPGVTKQTYRPYASEENKQVYEQSQQQRGLERYVRNNKRQAELATARGDDPAKYKENVKAGQKKLRKFTAETGRTRRYDREQIYSP